MVSSTTKAPPLHTTVRIDIRPDPHLGWLAVVAVGGEHTAILGRSRLPALMRSLAYLAERTFELADPS